MVFNKGDHIARIGRDAVFHVTGVSHDWYEVIDITSSDVYRLPECFPTGFVEREFVLVDTFEERGRGKTMVDFDKTEYNKGDVLVQIGGTELWTVVEDRGFFYAIEKGNGYRAIRVSLPKPQVHRHYVRVNDIPNEGGEE